MYIYLIYKSIVQCTNALNTTYNYFLPLFFLFNTNAGRLRIPEHQKENTEEFRA